MNFKKIKAGSVVKLWHVTRGHDYVVVGKNIANNELLLVKNNCLNADGTVHKATKRVHKRIPYSSVTGQSLVRDVRTVMGQKNISNYQFDNIFEDGDLKLASSEKFVCPAVNARTVSFPYK